MKGKRFLVILFLILAIFLSGCAGIVTPSVNLSGNWTMTNSSASGVTTAKCSIVDNSGSLTLNNFYILNQSYMNWNTGFGTFNNSEISANVSGSYLSTSGPVTVIVYFAGTINPGGISGTGTWIQSFSVPGQTWTVSGTTIFIKG